MNAYDIAVFAYASHLSDALLVAAEDEVHRLVEGGRVIAATVARGGVVHLFGAGHSALVAADPVGRAGSLAPLNQIVDRSEDMAERLPGYGRLLAQHYDQQYGLREGETLIVVSNSGVNPLPIELAMAARERGLSVVAITNLAQSSAQESRHESGKRLFEVAHVALDNHAPAGESLLQIPGVRQRVASVGTITGAFLVNSVLAVAVHELAKAGVEPPILVSENQGDDGAAQRNAELRSRYAGRLRRAGV